MQGKASKRNGGNESRRNHDFGIQRRSTVSSREGRGRREVSGSAWSARSEEEARLRGLLLQYVQVLYNTRLTTSVHEQLRRDIYSVLYVHETQESTGWLYVHAAVFICFQLAVFCLVCQADANVRCQAQAQAGCRPVRAGPPTLRRAGGRRGAAKIRGDVWWVRLPLIRSPQQSHYPKRKAKCNARQPLKRDFYADNQTKREQILSGNTSRYHSDQVCRPLCEPGHHAPNICQTSLRTVSTGAGWESCCQTHSALLMDDLQILC